MLKLEQLAAVVVAAGLAIVSYLLFFSWAGGGGYERRRPTSGQFPGERMVAQEPLTARRAP
mgnify:FL=1